MAVYHVLFNSLSANKAGTKKSEELRSILSGDDLSFEDVTKIADYQLYLKEIPEGHKIVLSGGDGTLNYFINHCGKIREGLEIYHYPTGTGNDFMNDVSPEDKKKLILLNPYIERLPKVVVKGKEYYFINGVGFGIDGYCCEVGDELKTKSDKPVNYTAIAIKGLLFYYKPTHATITVDGKKYEFEKAWLAPTMLGRFYGGGMMATPNQDRLAKDQKLTVMTMYGKGKIKTLSVFPSIFKGEHIKHKEMVECISGKEITVEFDRPVALQIDGETIKDVTSYTATAAN